MEVVILSGADSDMDEIYSHVEESEGGERFLLAVDRELELIRNYPRLVPASLLGKVRRVRIKRTQYGLFYTIQGNRLMIIAIQDLRQNPVTLGKIIQERL